MVSCSNCEKAVRIKQVNNKYKSDFMYRIVDGSLRYFCCDECYKEFVSKYDKRK